MSNPPSHEPHESLSHQPREVELFDGAFTPCFDLVLNGVVLACVFYDEMPECAYASIEVENDDGEVERLPGAAAGLDEDPVGWCLQFTDQPREVEVIARVPASWQAQVRSLALAMLAERLRARGPWRPAPDFRLWETLKEDPGESEGDIL